MSPKDSFRYVPSFRSREQGQKGPKDQIQGEIVSPPPPPDFGQRACLREKGGAYASREPPKMKTDVAKVALMRFRSLLLDATSIFKDHDNPSEEPAEKHTVALPLAPAVGACVYLTLEVA